MFQAGVSDRQLEDKETRDFIYEFIYAHGGVDAAKSEVLDITNAAKSLYPPPPSVQIPPTPPPVPARTPVNVRNNSCNVHAPTIEPTFVTEKRSASSPHQSQSSSPTSERTPPS